jgi:hypothetical protein
VRHAQFTRSASPRFLGGVSASGRLSTSLTKRAHSAASSTPYYALLSVPVRGREGAANVDEEDLVREEDRAFQSVLVRERGEDGRDGRCSRRCSSCRGWCCPSFLWHGQDRRQVVEVEERIEEEGQSQAQSATKGHDHICYMLSQSIVALPEWLTGSPATQ